MAASPDDDVMHISVYLGATAELVSLVWERVWAVKWTLSWLLAPPRFPLGTKRAKLGAWLGHSGTLGSVGSHFKSNEFQVSKKKKKVTKMLKVGLGTRFLKSF